MWCSSRLQAGAFVHMFDRMGKSKEQEYKRTHLPRTKANMPARLGQKSGCLCELHNLRFDIGNIKFSD